MSTATPDLPERIEAVEDAAERRMALVEVAVQQYGQYILNYLFGLTRCHADAEDIYQDLFCHVMEYFVEENITHVGFLKRKAHQLFCDKWRRQDRSPVTVEEQPPELDIPAFQEPLDDVEEQRFKVRFFEEYRFLGLTPEQEDALWYHCRHHYTYREIAKIMKSSPSTVGDWITKARQLFIKHIDVER